MLVLKHTFSNQVLHRGSSDTATKLDVLKEAIDEGINLSYVDLNGFDLSNLDLAGTNFLKANFSQANLTDGQFTEGNNSWPLIVTATTSFGSIALRLPTPLMGLFWMMFVGAAMLYISENKSDLKQADFTEANLTRTCFKGIDLTNAKFDRSIQIGADFRECDLTGISLESAEIKDVQLVGARMNKKTYDIFLSAGVDVSEVTINPELAINIVSPVKPPSI